jgi:hypothetical protein
MPENGIALPAGLNAGTFTKVEIAELSGVTIRFIERLCAKGVIIPHVVGGCGKGDKSRYAIMEALGVSVCAAFVKAGLHQEWGYAACQCLAAMEPGRLVLNLAAGRTFLALRPEGGGVLVKPYLSPNATRGDRLLLAQLNVGSIYRRLLARLMEKVPPHYRPGLGELADKIAEKVSAATEKT